MWTELCGSLRPPFRAGKSLLECSWRDLLFDPVSVDAGVMSCTGSAVWSFFRPGRPTADTGVEVGSRLVSARPALGRLGSFACLLGWIASSPAACLF